MKIGIAFLALIVAAGALVSPAYAQELTSGTIAGKVTDPAGKPIPGAVIIATSQHGTRTAEADANGNYVLPFLRPGTYNVRVEAPGGFNTVIQNDVSVGLNQRTNLNFTLEPGKTETVTVTGRSPLVDPQSTSSGTNLKYDEFANAVPLGRSFTDTYAVAPGVVSGLGTGTGNYSIGGASGLENAYLIDGVNITNTGYGGIGSYNIVYGSLGVGVTSEFLDEVQIKTGGFEAEYGQALGGIINTIVKSGTNEFKGSVAWYANPGGTRGSNQLVELDSGNSNLVGESINDFAFSLGGPIVKDKLFYFVAYNPVTTTQDLRAIGIPNPAAAAAAAGVMDFNGDLVFDEGANPNAYGVAPLAFPSAGQKLERERTSDNYAVKFNWQMSPKHSLELTAFGDPATGKRGTQRGDTGPLFLDFASGGGQSRITYGSNNQSLKWSAVFTPKFFMEAQIAHHDGEFRENSTLNDVRYTDIRNNQEFTRGAAEYDDPVGGLTPFNLTPVNTLRGGVGFISNQDDENLQYLIKFTNILGNHEIKYGVQYDDISYKDTGNYTGPQFNINQGVRADSDGDLTTLPADFDLDGIQDAVILTTRGGGLVSVRNTAGGGGSGDPTVAYDTPNIFRATRGRISPEAPATETEEVSAFIQDTWRLHPRLTLKAGVRYTTEKVAGSGSFLQTFASGTTSFTPSEHTFAGNWAPRLGLVWDVHGNGKSRAWANWGRYFQRIPNDLAVRAFSNEVGISRVEYDDRALTQQRMGSSTTCDDGAGGTTPCTTWATTLFQGIQPSNVVGGAQLPYEDELSGGYAFELSPNTAIEVRAIYRTQGRALEDVQVNAIEQVENYYYGYAYGYPYDPFGGSPDPDPSTPVCEGGVCSSTTFPGTPFGSYELGNPGTNQVPTGGLFGFPKAVRRYKALELIFTRRFTDNWSLYANYRFARLVGNYEGLFRNDNGQSDPNITSLFDFPNSPLMSGQFAAGPLPADVSHVLHIYPTYQFGNKLRLGANFSWASGVPRTSMLAHPNYQNRGEIPGINPIYAYWQDQDISLAGGGCDSDPAADTGAPCTLVTTPRLSDALADPDNALGFAFLKDYTPVKRGNLGRTPDLVTLDLHADYPLQTGKTSIRFMFDIFNVFQTQEVIDFDDDVEIQAGVTNPDFLKPTDYQAPRIYRFAARWDF
jgi:outer membrane receptor for ferrienterochelin and colicin